MPQVMSFLGAAQCSAGKNSVVQKSTVQYRAVLYSAVECSATQYSTVQHSSTVNHYNLHSTSAMLFYHTFLCFLTLHTTPLTFLYTAKYR